VLSGRGLCD